MHSLFRMVPSSVCGDVVFLFFFLIGNNNLKKVMKEWLGALCLNCLASFSLQLCAFVKSLFSAVWQETP